jgi:predicted Fe-Mo cluster-binding NifX family protein
VAKKSKKDSDQDPNQDPNKDSIFNYVVETKDGLVVVTKNNGNPAKAQKIKKADKPLLVDEIKDLLKIRRKAGRKISKLLRDKGIGTASMHRATLALGDGE